MAADLVCENDVVTTWICLLRAINLGARNKVPMPALRESLTQAGFTDVRTYVPSGNVVACSRHRSPATVSAAVADVVRRDFGVDQPVVVRSPEQVERVIAENPFVEAAAERPTLLHVSFLLGTPGAVGVDAIHTQELTRDACRVVGDHLYIDFGDAVHGSKLTGPRLARLLGVDGTARNWRTMLALAELAR